MQGLTVLLLMHCYRWNLNKEKKGKKEKEIELPCVSDSTYNLTPKNLLLFFLFFNQTDIQQRQTANGGPAHLVYIAHDVMQANCSTMSHLSELRDIPHLSERSWPVNYNGIMLTVCVPNSPLTNEACSRLKGQVWPLKSLWLTDFAEDSRSNLLGLTIWQWGGAGGGRRLQWKKMG